MIDFVQYVKPDYEANWHHQLLCGHLDKLYNGEIKRLMVFMPPQHGKSELVSRSYPAYILGRNPKAKIALASYSADLSTSFNRDCQRIIDSQLYHDVYPKTYLNKTNIVTVAKGNWLRNMDIFETVEHGGFLKTVGIGTPLTGSPADYLIIDDPVKDSIEAMSPTFQFRNWNWWTDVAYSRIHNSTRILITQTRWDVNDLSGKLLKLMQEGGEQWTVLCLPAVCTAGKHPEDPRSVGEALWPDRHELAKLQIVRKQSLRTFEALYQQNPKPMQSGGEFWKQFDVEKHVSLTEMADTSLHITVDDNVNPYVPISIWQVKGKRLQQVHELCCVDPENNAPKAARKLAKWLTAIDYRDVVFLYGDPSAKKRSTIDENSVSFFSKFIQELRAAGFMVSNRVQPSPPRVAISASFVNDIYENEIMGYSIMISETCTVSIEDYYTVKEDKDGTMLKPKRKDPATGITYEPYGHFSDIKRYFICSVLATEFKAYCARQRGGGSVSVSME